MIAVVGAERGFTVKQPPTDVAVVTRWRLVSFLRELPEVLDEDAVKQTYAAVRHLATWQPETVAWQDYATE